MYSPKFGMIYLLNFSLPAKYIVLSHISPSMPFISFPFLNKVPKTFSIMLNSRGERRHHCFVSNLKGKAFSLSSSMIRIVVVVVF